MLIIEYKYYFSKFNFSFIYLNSNLSNTIEELIPESTRTRETKISKTYKIGDKFIIYAYYYYSSIDGISLLDTKNMQSVINFFISSKSNINYHKNNRSSNELDYIYTF